VVSSTGLKGVANMCLAVPGRITEIEDTTAQVDFGGVTREASLVLVPDAAIGDFVLVHAGFAIEKLDESEAEETLRLFRELAHALDDDGKGDAGRGNGGDRREPRERGTGPGSGEGGAAGGAE
jgi:hydrogenase expression/formation protein HypC